MFGVEGLRAEYPGLVCDATARLSEAEIRRVRKGDLPPKIEAAGISLEEVRQSVGDLDEDDVYLLARIVRRVCQKRMNEYHHAHGRPGNWRDAY